MDIKGEISKIVEKISKDKDLLEKFKKDPVKTVEGLLGVDLPDEMIEKIVDGVKAKISLDQVSDAMSALKKLF